MSTLTAVDSNMISCAPDRALGVFLNYLKKFRGPFRIRQHVGQSGTRIQIVTLGNEIVSDRSLAEGDIETTKAIVAMANEPDQEDPD